MADLRLVSSDIYRSTAACAIGEAFTTDASTALLLAQFIIVHHPNRHGLGKLEPFVIIDSVLYYLPDVRVKLTDSFVNKLFDILENTGTVKRYTCENKNYYEVCNWNTYQTIRWKGKNRIPPPPWWSESETGNIIFSAVEKSREEKRIVENSREDVAKPKTPYAKVIDLYWQCYLNEFNKRPPTDAITGKEGKLVNAALKRYGFDMLHDAILLAFASRDSFISDARKVISVLFSTSVLQRLTGELLSRRAALNYRDDLPV